MVLKSKIKNRNRTLAAKFSSQATCKISSKILKNVGGDSFWVMPIGAKAQNEI